MALGTNYKRNVDAEQKDIDARFQIGIEMGVQIINETGCNEKLAIALAGHVMVQRPLQLADALQLARFATGSV